MASRSSLFSYGFVTLSLTALFGFCNIAIFYTFYHYLVTLGIPHQWIGVLLILQPLTACVVRPFISPFLHAGNGLRYVYISLLVNGLALLWYPFALTIPALVAVRILHGVAFVVLLSSVATLLVLFIPPEKSGQGFGIFSLSSLIPYAILPPLNEWALARFGLDESTTYAMAVVFVIPALLFLAPMRGILAGKKRDQKRPPRQSISLALLLANLATPGIGYILGANFCFFTASTTILYMIKDFAPTIGVANAGVFFTVSTAAIIAMRLGGNMFFDRWDKKRVLLGTGILFCLVLVFFGHLSGRPQFLLATVIYGICLGIILPLLNAVMFLISPDDLRGLNTNLMLFMMDVAFVVGPLCGAFIMGRTSSFAILFGVAACCALGGVVCVSRLPQRVSDEQPSVCKQP
ncbi:MFS transporter [Desulfoplanes formicivorans]|uniref:MFS transporter n=1 Tax=Desulfoplanes formicivorans TaxID=1592317 RepID=A0A194AI97_9BACT|nr:MFS transporter [Desulfoplanes formicivorans]GAU08955.1 MFS transporter [Desulfoplanes formicivorans]